MSGWGKTSGNGGIPDNLQYAYTYLISEAECKATWGNQVTARMQCANDDTNSACNVSVFEILKVFRIFRCNTDC